MKLRSYEDTCLITVRIGDTIELIGDNKRGQLIDIELAPNSPHDPTIVVILTIKYYKGSEWVSISATSNHFRVVNDVHYLERMYK